MSWDDEAGNEFGPEGVVGVCFHSGSEKAWQIHTMLALINRLCEMSGKRSAVMVTKAFGPDESH